MLVEKSNSLIGGSGVANQINGQEFVRIKSSTLRFKRFSRSCTKSHTPFATKMPDLVGMFWSVPPRDSGWVRACFVERINRNPSAPARYRR